MAASSIEVKLLWVATILGVTTSVILTKKKNAIREKCTVAKRDLLVQQGKGQSEAQSQALDYCKASLFK